MRNATRVPRWRVGLQDVNVKNAIPYRWIAALAVLVIVLSTVGPILAVDPLYQLDPYDQITLDQANENVVLKVRSLPQNTGNSPRLRVRLLDRPDQEFEIDRKAIAKIETFDQLVLKEANDLVKAGKLDEAYEYFQFLQEKYPKLAGLVSSSNEYLFEEAKAKARKGQFDSALGMLREIHSRNAERPELEKALSVATEKLMEQYRAADNFSAVRTLLSNLAAMYPQNALVVGWEAKLKELAASLAAEARKALAEGRLREADRAIRRLVEVWPATPGTAELLTTISAKYPRVIVGVNEPAVSVSPGSLHCWPSRRGSRLVYRTLMEFVGPGSEGGKYICPVGEMEILELGLRLNFEIKRGLRWSSGSSTLTGFDVSRRLLATADPADPAYRVEWAEIFTSVSVDRVYSVQADLRRPHVRPQALLQTTILPYSDASVEDRMTMTNGPFAVDSRSEGEVVFTANPRYASAGATQPKEIVERRLPDSSEALRALRRRQVDVLDRINPWEVDKVAAMPDVAVEPYAVPLVHCLVPNLQRPLVSSRTFRRALVYGLQRKAILTALVGGKDRSGCQVISGPFSPGVSRDDPLDYAYDRTIEPRGYDPRLAIGLAEVAFRELAAAKKKQGQTLKTMPTLVLAHPADETARLASVAIKKQLALVGIPITLQELPPGAPGRMDDKIDLLYAELAMWEPVVDARRLLDRDGLSGSCSPYMSLALRQLEQAADWPQVGLKLRQIHALAHAQVAVVPLWQLSEHFAYRRSVSGIGQRPVTLYQNVEAWKTQFNNPAEEK